MTPRLARRPETVEQANANPEVFARKTVGQVADHFDEVIGGLERKPAIDRALVRRAARADPRRPRPGRASPSRSTRRRSAACCRCRSRRSGRCDSPRAIPPTAGARYRSPTSSFATRSPTPSARRRPSSCMRPSPCRRPGAPIFQAASANLNPWTEVKVDSENPMRGPLLVISGEKDHTVPPAIANAAYKRQAAKPGRHRDRRDRRPRTLADDRQRLARGRRHGAGVCAAVHLSHLSRPKRRRTPAEADALAPTRLRRS